MTQILPQARTPFDVLGADVGAALQSVLPGAVQQGYTRQLGVNALNQAEMDLSQAGNDPYKMALAIAKAVAVNPNLERAAGPLLQTAMSKAQLNNAYGGSQGGGAPSAQGMPQAVSPGMPSQMPQQQIGGTPTEEPRGSTEPSQDRATPSAFNIMSPESMDAEAKRFAIATNNPGGYQQRLSDLQNLNTIAKQQRQDLEQFGLDAGIPTGDLPIFMRAGAKFDASNPTEWAIKAKQEYKTVKSNLDKLDRATFPDIASRIQGYNREEELGRLQGSVKDLVDAGFENEVRETLANNYLSPTEIESLIRPLSSLQKRNLRALPKGPFEKESDTKEKGYYSLNKERNNFYTMEEKNPQAMKKMKDDLTDYFLNNVDEDTSLLALRHAILQDKNYDWRQIGSALRQAQENGLKFTQRQLTEMTDVESNPPMQSLPDIFKGWGSRIPAYLRGAK